MKKLYPLLCAVALAKEPGVFLEDLTWNEAEKALTPETVVVIPLGAAAKEHGPHLKLKNDWLIAEYLKKEVRKQAKVVVAPTVNYHYYPAFVEYPGSTSLRLETARDLIIDICRSLSKFGPKKFYVLNTGISTIKPLEAASQSLLIEGIKLRYSNLSEILGPIEKEISKQTGGTHADEIETSMMLVMAPRMVDMKKAPNDYHVGKGPLTRNPNGPGVYSATGTWGNATLATKAKGEKLVRAYLEGVQRDITLLQASP